MYLDTVRGKKPNRFILTITVSLLYVRRGHDGLTVRFFSLLPRDYAVEKNVIRTITGLGKQTLGEIA